MYTLKTLRLPVAEALRLIGWLMFVVMALFSLPIFFHLVRDVLGLPFLGGPNFESYGEVYREFTRLVVIYLSFGSASFMFHYALLGNKKKRLIWFEVLVAIAIFYGLLAMNGFFL